MNSVSRKLVVIISLLLLSGLTVTSFAQKSAKRKASAKVTKVAKVEDKFLAKGDGIESCPVSGDKLENKTHKAMFFGREVYFCCDDCVATAKKNPELYVKKTAAEQIKAVQGLTAKVVEPQRGIKLLGVQGVPAKPEEHHHAAPATGIVAKFLGKGDGIESCPVTGEPIDKNIKAEINGKTVYACCAGCLEKVKKNPELYLKWAAQ